MKQSLKLQKEYWKFDDQILVQNIILLSLYGNSITCIFVAMNKIIVIRCNWLHYIACLFTFKSINVHKISVMDLQSNLKPPRRKMAT